MWPSRLLPTPFRLGQEEILRQRNAPNAPRKRGRTYDVETILKRATEEAAMMSIQAKPSDSRMVNTLYSFRAQADMLGTMGIFDDTSTEFGRVLHEQTGGHNALIRGIDSHIAEERQNEKLNMPKPDMNGYMRKDVLLPSALPYSVLDVFESDDRFLQLEQRRFQAEIDMQEEIKQAIDDAWNDPNAYDRIMAINREHEQKLIDAEADMLRDVVRVIDEQFAKIPIDPYFDRRAGKWSRITDDPEYTRLAKMHKKELATKRIRTDSDSPWDSSPMYTDASPDTYDTLPSLESVTATIFGQPQDDPCAPTPNPTANNDAQRETARRRRQAKLDELKGMFGMNDVTALQTQEFANDTGGACAYVSSFAKYMMNWSMNNKIQATLTAIPIGLGIASMAGVASISGSVYIPVLVGLETVKGIHDRMQRGESVVPPAIRRIRDAYAAEDGSLRWLTGTLLTISSPVSGNAILSAKNEMMLLRALKAHPKLSALGVEDIVKKAQSLREVATKLRQLKGSTSAIDNTFKMFHELDLRAYGETIAEYAKTSYESSAMGGESVRDLVDLTWKRGRHWLNFAGPIVLAGSVIKQSVNFTRNIYRPDRARLYLYCNDPEHDFNKQMLNDQQLAREVLPILYSRERGKGAFDRDNEQYTIKDWLIEFEEDKSNAKKCTEAWKSWYDGQTDWDAFSTDAILDAAKAVHQWKEPIIDLKTVLQKKFSFSGPVLQGMYTLNGLWASWEATWESMRDQARNGGSERSTNWLAISKEDMEGAYSQSMSPIWYKLYKVLQYQHAYIIGGVDPSKPLRANDARFKARANSSNRPSFVLMIEKIETWATEAKRIADMKTRRALELDNVSGLDTSELEKLFDKYYPGLAKAAVKKQKDRKKEQAEERAQRQNAPPNPPAIVLTPNDIQNLIAGMNHGNPGPQPDLGDGPLVEDADGNLPAIGPAPIAQSPVVDEVYARLRVLRL